MDSPQTEGSVPIGCLTASGACLMAFGGLIVLGAFIGPGKNYRWQKKVANEGIRTTVEVKALERTWSSASGRGRTYNYALEYTLEVEDGRSVTGYCALKENRWRKLDSPGKGRKIQIIYHRDEPQRGYPVGWEQEKTLAIIVSAIAAFGILVIALGMAVVILSRRYQRREKTQNRSGEGQPGRQSGNDKLTEA